MGCGERRALRPRPSQVVADIARRVGTADMFEMALVAVSPRGDVGAGCSFAHWHDHVRGEDWAGACLQQNVGVRMAAPPPHVGLPT